MALVAKTRDEPKLRGTFRPASRGTVTQRWIVSGASGSETCADVKTAIETACGLTVGQVGGDGYCLASIDVGGTVAVSQAFPAAGAIAWDATVNWVLSPLNYPIEIHWLCSHYKEATFTDLTTGKGLQNSFGDPYNPTPQVSRARARLEVVKRYALTDNNFMALIPQYVDHVNSTQWPNSPILLPQPFQANQVYCSDIRVAYQSDPMPHYAVTYCFEIDDRREENSESAPLVGWSYRALDCGTKYKDANGNPVSFRDVNGVLHGGIGLLDGHGGRLWPDGKPNPGIPPVYVKFTIYPSADFNSLITF